MKRVISSIMFTLLLVSIFTLAFHIEPAGAQTNTIYINSDGSVSPSSAPISSSNNITYTFIGDVSYPTYNGIVVQRSNIVIDGNGYFLRGNGSYLVYRNGFYVGVNNVTIRNTNIRGFEEGIMLNSSSYDTISGNDLTDMYDASIVVFGSSHGDTISYNSMTNSTFGPYLLGGTFDNIVILGNNIVAKWSGITLDYASNCEISGNSIVGAAGSSYETEGIYLYYSSNNAVFGNNVTNNNQGVRLFQSYNNRFWHNHFINNSFQVYMQVSSSSNFWDNGYPSGGNYWNDYNGSDLLSGPYQNLPGSDGIGDTHYVIDGSNTDNYPLKFPCSPPDIAIVGVMPYATTVYPPSPVFVSTTIENRGNKSESVTVNVYANTAVIGTKNVTVRPHTNSTFTTIWNTVGFAGEYAIGACAQPLEDEINILNNKLNDGYVSVMGKGYFIIVAGNRYDNDLLPTINYGCNQVYKILRSVGYTADEIYYLNQPECGYQDLDRDGKNDIDAWASDANLRWAIETWAASRTSPTQPLCLYLFDHGNSDVFGIDNAPEYLYSWQLASWLDNLEGTTGAAIHVIYAACHSGSFVDELSKAGRVVVTSSSADEYSYTIPGTWEAFSTPFWNQIKSGHSIGASFNYASSPLSLANWFLRFIYWLKGMHQTPLLDDNADGVGHSGYLPKGGDGYLANSIYIGACEWPYPWINQTLSSLFGYWPPTSNTTLWAKVENNTNLLNVRAYMLLPDWVPPNSTDILMAPGTECYEMTDPDHDGNWTVNIPVANFTNHVSETAPNANFTFFITAEQDNGDIATPSAVNIQFSKTLDFGIDEIPPYVSIERPLENRIVSNIITVNGTAFDDECLKKIEVYLDDNLCGTIDLPNASSSYYEFNLDTTLFENGNRTIMVKAFDMADNCYNQTLNIVFENFVHDIAITNAAASKNIVGQGFTINLTATIANHGSYPENMNLTIYANGSLTTSQTLSLSKGNCTTLAVNWNTTGFAKGNYTVWAYAEPVSGETATADNNFTGGWVKVTIVGDVNGDGKVNLIDTFTVALAFGSYPGHPMWNPNYDINNDGKINLIDCFITALNYGKTDT